MGSSILHCGDYLPPHLSFSVSCQKNGPMVVLTRIKPLQHWNPLKWSNPGMAFHLVPNLCEVLGQVCEVSSFSGCSPTTVVPLPPPLMFAAGPSIITSDPEGLKFSNYILEVPIPPFTRRMWWCGGDSQSTAQKWCNFIVMQHSDLCQDWNSSGSNIYSALKLSSSCLEPLQSVGNLRYRYFDRQVDQSVTMQAL